MPETTPRSPQQLPSGQPTVAEQATPAPPAATCRIRLVQALFFLLAALSGFVLRMAYLPFEKQTSLIWLAPIPFFLAVRLLPPKRAAKLAFIGAFCFFASALTWFWPLSENGAPAILIVLGEIGLSAYCATCVSLCAAALSRLHAPWRKLREQAREWDASFRASIPDSPEEDAAQQNLDAIRKKSLWLEIASPIAAGILWAGAEYFRATFGGGFGWYTLGSALIDFHALAHWASWGGIYLVSAFVAILADALAGVLVRTVDTIRRTPGTTRRHLDLTVALLILLLAFSSGLSQWKKVRGHSLSSQENVLRIAAINPEMPCVFNENQTEWDAGEQRLAERMRLASAAPVDLIIWPESAFWGILPSPVEEKALAGLAASYPASLLFGCSDTLTPDGSRQMDLKEGSLLFRNAAWCVTPAEPSAPEPSEPSWQTYAKRHLVPFGEYIPLDKTFPVLQRLSPTNGSCYPGEKPVLFEIPLQGNPDAMSVRVAPLICFEDTVPDIARTAARSADFLVSISNDAWFTGSYEALQHHTEARFRAIETGIPLIRVSNAGVTAIVFPTGISTENASGGFLSYPVPVPPMTSNPYRTLYAITGDWIFGIPCATVLFAVLLFPRRRKTVPQNG
ncbi:MAG: apolipoprotein N-acyltransferase [Kiritimatiellia bacterium]